MTRKIIILIKDVQKWVDQKMIKRPNEKKNLYSIKRPKFKKWVVQKMKGLKTLTYYTKWKP